MTTPITDKRLECINTLATVKAMQLLQAFSLALTQAYQIRPSTGKTMVPTVKIESDFASVRYAHGETDNQLHRARTVEPRFQLLAKGHWYLKNKCTK